MAARCGTTAAYADGCRCPPCTEANAEMARRARQRPPRDDKHGTVLNYDRGCHCGACRAANTERRRATRARRRSEPIDTTTTGS